MKVLFTFSGLPHYYNFVLNKLNSMPGIEITVIIPGNKSLNIGRGVHQTTKGINFNYIQLSEYKTFYGKTFFKDFDKTLTRINPDILVTGWPYILGIFFNPFLLTKIKNKKIKVIYKDIPFRIQKFGDAFKFKNSSYIDENLNEYKTNTFRYLINIGNALLRRFYLKIIDAHVNYIDMAYEIWGSYGVHKEKIFITYNSPDTDILKEAKEKASLITPILPVNRERIIHVGRLAKWKKVHLLIAAINILKNKYNNIELVIIGAGPEEENLKRQAKELNISQRIIFAGPIYDPVILARYMLESSIYVLAGIGGLSINEAMCFGKPVICSICDGTEKHLVFDDYNGKYFIENNADDLSMKIDYILSNPALIKTMGENSLKIINEKININTVINGYLKAFHYVCYRNKDLY